MPPTRDQFDAQVKRLQEQVQRGRAVDLSLLHSAAVRADQLTGDPAWDRYLQQLQARLDDAMASRANYAQMLQSAWDDTALRMAQSNWHIWNSRVDTLVECMELPVKVKETFKKESSQE